MTTGNEMERCQESFEDDVVQNEGCDRDDLKKNSDGSYRLPSVQQNFERWKRGWFAANSSPSPPPNTVRVRIPVAVANEHDWSACAWTGCEEDDRAKAIQHLRDQLGNQWPSYVVSVVTADVPLPSPPVEVEGTVE